MQAEGCERVFQDTASGAKPDRKGLAAALDACASGDVLTVWKLDRLGRSLLDLVGLVEDLKARDVGLKVLTGAGASIDTTKPQGRLFFALFAALAEFERELICERTRAGMKAAKRRGRASDIDTGDDGVVPGCPFGAFKVTSIRLLRDGSQSKH